MKKLSLIALTAIAVSLGASASVSEISVVPRPAHITVDSTDAVYRIPSLFTVSGSGSNGSRLAKTTARYLEMAGLKGAATRKDGDINVATDNALGNEDYTLAVRPERIDITSASDRGLFYAVQTLAQMTRGESELPLCTITDTPRHGYRGLMLDVVRCYIPPHEIKRFIDVASRLKINNLHLHLTDDNGWRLEIKKYPKLTEIGAWRVDRPELFPGRLNQRSASEPTPVGGFYTQAQMRDIVEYAAERHVNVIPEIEMPAHSAAAIASYPELACRSNNKFVGVFPNRWERRIHNHVCRQRQGVRVL